MEKPVNPLGLTKNLLGKPVEKKVFFIKFSMETYTFTCLAKQAG